MRQYYVQGSQFNFFRVPLQLLMVTFPWPYSTICVGLAATRVQFACNWRPHASNYSADGPWIFGLENALVLWMTKPHGSKFCMRLRPVACKAASYLQACCKNNYLNKKMRKPLKNLRMYATHVLN
jgi:hypothetical protein